MNTPTFGWDKKSKIHLFWELFWTSPISHGRIADFTFAIKKSISKLKISLAWGKSTLTSANAEWAALSALTSSLTWNSLIVFIPPEI